MKAVKKIGILLLCLGLLLGTTSCFYKVKEGKSTHKGWYKNSNNPHHENSTNPGKSKEHKK